MITRQPDKGFSKSPRFSVFIDGVHVAEVVGSPVRLSDGDKRVKHWDRYKRDYLTPGWRGHAYTVTAVAAPGNAWEGLTWYTANMAWEAIQDMYAGKPIRGEDLSPPPAPKSTLERAAEHYLQKEAEEEKATKTAVGCAGVGCGLPLAITVMVAVAIVALGLVGWIVEALFG